jgi:hypothetical protein
MFRKSCPKFIIISGSGKRVGKTHMATALIRAFSMKFPLLALKVSPHVHDSLGNTRLTATSEGIRIFQDLGPHHKNSGQFLEAGASQSFFMETDDEHLPKAFDIFMKECNPGNYPVICESGALGNLISPGILIFISDSTEMLRADKLKTIELADMVLPARSFDPQIILRQITCADGKWGFTLPT